MRRVELLRLVGAALLRELLAQLKGQRVDLAEDVRLRHGRVATAEDRTRTAAQRRRCPRELRHSAGLMALDVGPFDRIEGVRHRRRVGAPHRRALRLPPGAVLGVAVDVDGHDAQLAEVLAGDERRELHKTNRRRTVVDELDLTHHAALARADEEQLAAHFLLLAQHIPRGKAHAVHPTRNFLDFRNGQAVEQRHEQAVLEEVHALRNLLLLERGLDVLVGAVGDVQHLGGLLRDVERRRRQVAHRVRLPNALPFRQRHGKAAHVRQDAHADVAAQDEEHAAGVVAAVPVVTLLISKVVLANDDFVRAESSVRQRRHNALPQHRRRDGGEQTEAEALEL
eukprot:PhM_4_TR8839/c0_g1_i1/m.100563